jgi:hypothetical protein
MQDFCCSYRSTRFSGAATNNLTQTRAFAFRNPLTHMHHFFHFHSERKDEYMGFEVTVIDYETDEQIGQATIPTSLFSVDTPLDEWISLAPSVKSPQTTQLQSQIHVRLSLVTAEVRNSMRAFSRCPHAATSLIEISFWETS